MHVALEGLRIEADHVLFERLGLSDDLAIRSQRETRSVEDKAVIAADLVHHCDWDAVVFCDCRQHVTAQLSLVQRKRRSRDVQQELPAGANEVFYRIDTVE